MNISEYIRQGVLATLALAMLVASSSLATARVQADKDTTRQELQTLDQFLDSHPQVANDLRKNPALINDAVFVKQHRALADFLKDHPRVREELKENPGAFINRERGFERSEGPEGARRPDNDTTRAELANFDQFLDNHPAVGKELSKNPSLVDNAAYLSKHPALKDYLEDHPRVRVEIKENPNAFMNQEHRFERNEGKEPKQHAKRNRPDKDHDRDRR